jgi:hypothetical protein
MKFLISLILTALLSFIASMFGPWWIIAVVAFIVAAAIPQKVLMSFLAASLALFFLWGIQAFLINEQNNHLLGSKVAGLLFHRNSSALMIIVTGMVGAIVAGFAAISGSFLRKIVDK